MMIFFDEWWSQNPALDDLFLKLPIEMSTASFHLKWFKFYCILLVHYTSNVIRNIFVLLLI